MSAPAQRPSGEQPTRTMLGDYELLKEIGRGGMGSVYLATQVSLGRPVAVKILSKDLAKNADFVQRFFREARAVAQLNHPNLIQGIAVGEIEGQYFFAMEYVDGPSAMQRLKDMGGKLLEDEALDIAIQVARALEHAHKHGMVHRDIKPDNILLTNDGTAKLCDLGLAKLTRAEDAGLTQAGQAVGTPNYISPEQARGRTDVDIRSDLYSLGATTYHLLVGEPPYTGNAAAVIMTQHLAEPPRDAHAANPDVSPEFSGVLLRLMQKKPEDRYASPAELIADLEALKRGEAPARAMANPDANGKAAKRPRAGRPAGMGMGRRTPARGERSTGGVVQRSGAITGSKLGEDRGTGHRSGAVTSSKLADERGGTSKHPLRDVSTDEAKPVRERTRLATTQVPSRGGMPMIAVALVVLIAGAGAVVWFTRETPASNKPNTKNAEAVKPDPSDPVKNDSQVNSAPVERSAIAQGTTFLDASGAGQLGFALCQVKVPGATGVAVGDLDGDGKSDLILASSAQPVQVFRHTGAAGFAEDARTRGLEPFSGLTAHWCDINGDGAGDLSFLTADGLRTYLGLPGKPGAFVERAPQARPRFVQPQGSAWLDFDADGRPDFLAAGQQGLFLIRNGARQPQDVSRETGLGGGGPGRGVGDFLITLDLDGDAYADAIYNTGAQGVVLHNEGGKKFKALDCGIKFKSEAAFKVGLAAGDLNGDGAVDIFAPQNGRPCLFLNDGSGRFSEALDHSGDLAKLSGPVRAAALVDVDLDGDLDLIAALAAEVRLYLNDGPARFRDASASILKDLRKRANVSYVAVLDANADRVPDLFFYAENAPSALLLNELKPGAKAAPLVVAFPPGGHPTPLGARVEVADAWGRKQTQWVSGADGRGGQAGAELYFGVVAEKAKVKVVYAGGKRSAEMVANVSALEGARVLVAPPK
ncbi:MAG: hypothetical protein AMXMBFR7_41510 [Planctomycetota bacterium]